MNKYSIHLACLGAVLGILTVSAAAFGSAAARKDAARSAAGRPAEAAVSDLSPAGPDAAQSSADETREVTAVRISLPEEEAAPAFAPEAAADSAEVRYYAAVRVHRKPMPKTLDLANMAGSVLSSAAPDSAGDAVLGPLSPGAYALFADGARLGTFRILQNAVLTEADGFLWTDGELLHLSDYAAGQAELLLSFPRPGRYALRLQASSGSCREISIEIPETERQPASDRFLRAVSIYGLRPGSYVLFCGADPLCSFVLQAGEIVSRDAELP